MLSTTYAYRNISPSVHPNNNEGSVGTIAKALTWDLMMDGLNLEEYDWS